MKVISHEAVVSAPKYNEAEIRFHILDPIIRRLGYPSTESTYLFLEEKLEYPYLHIGRRSKKDLPLGFADFRAGVKGARGSFIVEAKAGSVQITKKEVEQAHSYAAHAQVGANYFVLCNGHSLSIYETLSGPQADPILLLSLHEIDELFHRVENILSPRNLESNCRIFYDTKLSLAPGLGSAVRIRSGRYLLIEHDIKFYMNGNDITILLRQNMPQLAEMDRQLELLKTTFEMRVSDGRVERGEDGKILAHFEFCGVTVPNQQAMAILGIDKASFVTFDKFLSTNPDNPSICESLNDFAVAKGTMMPQLWGGALPIDGDLHGDMFIKAAMYFSNGKFLGEYISISNQRIQIPGLPALQAEMSFSGTFELVLDN